MIHLPSASPGRHGRPIAFECTTASDVHKHRPVGPGRHGKAHRFLILPLFHLQGGAANQNLRPSASKGAAREDNMNQNLQPSASKGAAREGNETKCMSARIFDVDEWR